MNKKELSFILTGVLGFGFGIYSTYSVYNRIEEQNPLEPVENKYIQNASFANGLDVELKHSMGRDIMILYKTNSNGEKIEIGVCSSGQANGKHYNLTSCERLTSDYNPIFENAEIIFNKAKNNF